MVVMMLVMMVVMMILVMMMVVMMMITLRLMMMAILMTALLHRCLCQSGTQRSTFCSSRNEYALHTTAIDGKDGQNDYNMRRVFKEHLPF